MTLADMAQLEALVIAILVLILAPGYLFYFDITPKVVTLLGGTALVLAATALTGSRIPGKSSRWLRFFSILLLLNVASLVLSTALSGRPQLSLFGSDWRRFGSLTQAALCLFAWLVAVTCAGKPGRVTTVLRGVSLAGAASAVYGILQYFGWDPLLPSAAYHVGEGVWTIVRPPGTLGYASYFATWLLVVVFLSVALQNRETSGVWRWFARSAALLAGGAMLLTGTRAALLGLTAGAVVWRAVQRIRLRPRFVLLAATILATCAIFYLSNPGRQMRARSRWFVEDPWGGARLDLWRDSLKMAAHRLPAGYGPEVFTAEFPRFESLPLARAYPSFAYESPHNIFLDALVAQGVPGFLLLAALCGAGFVAAFQRKQAAFAAALAAAIVSQQFTAFTIPTALIFWVILALLAAPDSVPFEFRIPRAAATVAAGLISAVLLYYAARFAVADHALASAQQQLARGDLQAAEQQYRRYQRAALPGGGADIWYSRELLALASRAPNLAVRIGAVNEAGTAAFRATQTAEDPFNAWYNLAVFCGTQNNAGCVEQSLRQSIQAHPLWFKPHWALAQVLRMTGRIGDAQHEAGLAAELDAGKDPEVARTLHQIRTQLARANHPNLQK